MNQSALKLQNFRKEVYQLLGPAKDSTFDLMDAVLVTRTVYSFAELSLSPVFRRKWPSLYEAIDDCRPKAHKLMKRYLQEIPTPTSQRRIILAGDHTPWPRTEAPTLKDRTYEHGAKVISGKPITLGHGYSTLAWIPEDKGSWALPLRHDLITSHQTPIIKAIWQLRQVCRQLKQRPITLWDSEYGCAKFVKMTKGINADFLMRLSPNRCIYAEPPKYQGKGRPRKHGQKIKLSDPTTWGIPVESIEINDPTWGRVEITRWSKFHFYQSASQPMEIVLIQRKGKGLSKKAAKPMWLAWLGEEILSLKWLAREIIEDEPLPWQKPQPREKLTPGRVAQGFSGVLAVIETPAKKPKPRGKSPGWEQGKKRNKRPHYPTVKKTVTRQKKAKKKAA
ncbi:transposase [Crocosphaera sp.]|uniref:transposase n=1 Tax=Crocosphaera sp. TaxID=2729996 RepID=UPI003F21EC89|nr:transposase [Crocosphaera sp.]